MAAGMGSRYGGLKQIDPVGNHGEIILDFSLYDAMLAGFERVVFVIKEENEEDFRALIDDRAGKYLEVNYAFQKKEDLPEGYEVPEGREKPWGTAHAVYSARKYIDAPFCVINADDYYGPGAFQTIYEFLEQLPEQTEEQGEEAGGEIVHEESAAGESEHAKDTYAMVAFQLDKTLTENGHVARGVCEVSDSGILECVTERTKIMWRPLSDVSGVGDPDNAAHDAEMDKNAASVDEDAAAGESADMADEEIRVPAFTEDNGESWNQLSPDTPVSMNFWGFSSTFVDAIAEGFPEFLDSKALADPMKAEYFLPSVVTEKIEDGTAEVKVLRSQDKWYGVTYKEDKETVVNALQSMKDNGLYPEKLWN